MVDGRSGTGHFAAWETKAGIGSYYKTSSSMTAETRIFMGNHICLPSVGMSKSASRHDRQASKTTTPPSPPPPKLEKRADARMDTLCYRERQDRYTHAAHRTSGLGTARRGDQGP